MTQVNWLNKQEYPFKSNYLTLPAGRLHYIDEGRGEPLLFVHGTPVWSFVYRNLIKDLAADYRVIAVDHLGFGLSDKPDDWDATPAAHALNLQALIEHLDLKNITLGVHDFGGPIGLSYAVENPANVARLIIFNTWMWALDDDANIRKGSMLFGSFLGKLLYKGLNLSPKMLIPQMMGDKSKLTKAIHEHYTKPFPGWKDRHAPWVFARELMASGNWFESLWSRRNALGNIPMLILWGMKDPGFGEKYLKRWESAFPQAEIVKFEDAGHFVQEEKPAEAIAQIRRFLAATGK